MKLYMMKGIKKWIKVTRIEFFMKIFVIPRMGEMVNFLSKIITFELFASLSQVFLKLYLTTGIR